MDLILKSVKRYWPVLFLYLLYTPLVGFSLFRSQPFKNYYEDFTREEDLILLVSLLLLLVLYLAIVSCYQGIKAQVNLRSLLLYLVPLLLLLIATPPLFSRDILAYLIHARNRYIFGQGIYTTSMAEFTQNPWYAYIAHKWRGPSIYGPYFNLFMAPVFLFNFSSIWIHSIIYKLLLSAVFIFSVVFYLKSCKVPFLSRFLLIMLNPSVLVHFFMDGHNDALVLSMLLLGIAFMKSRREVQGLLFTLLAVFMKYIPVMVIPSFLLYKKTGVTKRFLLLVFFASVLFLMGWGFFPDYVSGSSSLNYGSYGAKCLYTCSPTVTIINFLSGSYAYMAKLGILAAALGFLSFRLLASKISLEQFYFWSYFSFSSLISFLAPWYLTYPIVFGLLINDKRYRGLSVALTCYSLLHYFGV